MHTSTWQLDLPHALMAEAGYIRIETTRKLSWKTPVLISGFRIDVGFGCQGQGREFSQVDRYADVIVERKPPISIELCFMV